MPESMREALSTRRFDVVFDNVYDLGARHHGRAGGSHRACLRRPLTRYIFLSSVAAYGDGLNHKESDPLAPDYHADALRPPQGDHGAAALPHARAERPAGGDVPAAVRLRTASNPFYREQFFWDRLRAGRPIVIPGDGHRLMQFVYVHDLVQAMVRSMEEPRAVGEVVQHRRPQAA